MGTPNEMGSVMTVPTWNLLESEELKGSRLILVICLLTVEEVGILAGCPLAGLGRRLLGKQSTKVRFSTRYTHLA